MPLHVRLFPGFPLPAADYATMLEGLASRAGPDQDIVVAHSLGALEALSHGSTTQAPVFLLAPSAPEKRRIGRPVVRAVLHLLGRSPDRGVALARYLRSSTYRRYGAQAPPVNCFPSVRPPAAFVIQHLRHTRPTRSVLCALRRRRPAPS